MSLKSAAYFLGTHLPFVMMYFYILEDSLYLFIYLFASICGKYEELLLFLFAYFHMLVSQLFKVNMLLIVLLFVA